MSPENKKYMAIEDVAEMLGVNYQLIYRLIRSGDLPAIRLGRIYRVTQEDLNTYLKKQKTSTEESAPSAGINTAVPFH